MVIDDLDRVGMALAKFEADTPALVDRHRPLAAAVTLELVEADASQWAQIVKRFGDIHRQQKINGGFEIQAAKLVWPLASRIRDSNRMAEADPGISVPIPSPPLDGFAPTSTDKRQIL